MSAGEGVSDKDIRLFFDAADKLLQAVRTDGDKSRKATIALSQARQQMDERLQILEKEIIQKIDTSAQSTATQAADLLATHFSRADKAAEKAAARYEKAAGSLNSRTWIYFIGAQLVLITVVSVLILALVPSLDEIEQRRATLGSLNQQIKDIPLYWSTCGEGKQKQKCLRTDERDGRPYTTPDGGTWRIPWKD